MYGLIVLVVVMLYAIGILFVFPMRDVTQPPERGQTVREVLLPGVSPAWHFLGGLALIAWCYFLLQGFFLIWLGSPWIITRVAIPNFTRAYGVPGDSPNELSKLVNPSWVWLYLAPVVLFAVNLLLVFRDKLFRRSV